jgi:hypothetical protein
MTENCNLLRIDTSVTSQTGYHRSFLGGKPRLPDDEPLPWCQLCGAQQTFFFQVAFPPGHPWKGFSLAVFACTTCAHEDYTIPEMLPGRLQGAHIPENFLNAYQVNFRLLVFKTAHGRLRREYVERVRFAAWKLVPADVETAFASKVGGQPAWILGDETPALYGEGISLVFLMQLVQDFEFPIVENAPQQARLFQFPDMKPLPFYRLFNANALYFFGTMSHAAPLVYLLTQCD